jgi:ABC-type Mn2+/Zn2+ transport system permease subunit
LLIGATIAIAVLVVGPLVAFGFIIIPPLISRIMVKSMRGFICFSSFIGGVCAFSGFALAYKYDLPVGALDITLLGVILILTFLFKDIFKLFIG